MRPMTTPNEAGWPTDMVIRVNEYDRQLMELLFFRDALGLEPSLDIPLLTVRPRTMNAGEWPPTDEPNVLSMWRDRWDASWAWILRSQELHASAVPPHIIWETLGEQPRWRDDPVSADAVTQGFEEWLLSVETLTRSDKQGVLDGVSDRALIRAWELGLQAIFVLPFAEEYAVRTNDHCLVISTATANHADSLERSLHLFV